MSVAPLRRRAALVAALACAIGLGAPVPSHAQGKSALNLAMVGEPQTLDSSPRPPTWSASSCSTSTSRSTPSTPSGTWCRCWPRRMPKISADGKTYTIALRKGVKLHNGRELERRRRGRQPEALDGAVAARQVGGGKEVEPAHGQGPARASRSALKNALCAAAGAAGDASAAWPPSWPRNRIAQPLKEFVGTGPYKFKERRPDQYVLLTRFDGYSARKEAPERLRRQARGHDRRAALRAGAQRQHARRRRAGRPVPLRRPAAGRGAGPRSRRPRGKVVPIMTPSFGFPYLVFNTKEGSMAQQPVRQAVQMALGAGRDAGRRLRRHALLRRRGQPLPQGHAVLLRRRHRPPTTSATPRRPRSQAEQAGYKGEPIRILTSRQYDFHYNMALMMAEQLKRAGFKADLQRGRLGHAGAAPRRPEAVGHLHHALGPVPRADALAAAAGRRRAGLVELAGQAGSAGRLQPGAQPGQARPAVGPRCSRWCTTRCPTSTSASSTACRRARRRWRATRPHTWPVLLEHQPEELSAGRTAAACCAISLPAWPACWSCWPSWRCWCSSSRAPRSGDPVAVLLGDQATAEDIARVQKVYGLDKPLPVQFVLWLRELAQRQPGRVDLPAAAGDAGAVGARRADHAAVADGGRHRGADRRAVRHRLGGLSRPRWSTRCSPASRCSAPACRASGSA